MTEAARRAPVHAGGLTAEMEDQGRGPFPWADAVSWRRGRRALWLCPARHGVRPCLVADVAPGALVGDDALLAPCRGSWHPCPHDESRVHRYQPSALRGEASICALVEGSVPFSFALRRYGYYLLAR